MATEEAGIIAANMCGHLNAEEQAFFIAGFQEAIKYLNYNQLNTLQSEKKMEEFKSSLKYLLTTGGLRIAEFRR